VEGRQKGEFKLIYALTLRKAAAMLADCMSGKELAWERKNYRQKHFCAEYERVLLEFEDHISPTLSQGSVENVLITAR
jgi:hypothetical protein